MSWINILMLVGHLCHQIKMAVQFGLCTVDDLNIAVAKHLLEIAGAFLFTERNE
ncbi:MAG: hypothetical protein Q4D52_06470 [Eubacteriales bacterium]|nr:hypothetical protein [Eubacteriales bacterium]